MLVLFVIGMWLAIVVLCVGIQVAGEVLRERHSGREERPKKYRGTHRRRYLIG